MDVDSGNRLHASATGDIVLVETAGNANVGRIGSSGGNVAFTVTGGSIFDADADAAADFAGNAITLTANNATITPAPTMGTLANGLEIDSNGPVRVLGRGEIYLIETTVE